MSPPRAPRPTRAPDAGTGRAPRTGNVSRRPRYPRLRYELEPAARGDRELRAALRRLPWKRPLAEWRDLGVRHLRVRHGVGRHPVAFIQVNGAKLVVKELGGGGARREVAVYRELRRRGIEALEPVGAVIREDAPVLVPTAAGEQVSATVTGHTVTRLAERVVPDSLLVPLGFARENRRRIWDALLDLFTDLHAGGVYWGDASPANALIRFTKELVPLVGPTTRLRAVLADAETVEIRDRLSDALRRADLDGFLEGLVWLSEDLRLAGLVPEPRVTGDDLEYLRGEYDRRYRIAVEERAFGERTGLDVRALLGRVRDATYLETLERHIDEHKWYLSEQAGRELPSIEAAADWYERVFVPVCALFRSEDVLDLFPGKTASELYVEVMTHKYFLSRTEGRDVGMGRALRDYAERFGRKPLLASFWNRMGRKLVQILGMKEQTLLGGDP